MNTGQPRRFHGTSHTAPGAAHLLNQKGMVLVLTLMVLVLITAMVVEFAYGVYTSTSALHNWKESQKLSFVSKSGVSLAMKTIQSDIPLNELYRFSGRMDIPVENILEGFTGTIIVSVEDENAKFNLNSITGLWPGGTQKVSDSFKTLLKQLGFNEAAVKDITGRIVDWIDVDSIPSEGLSDSEEGAKNAYMDSVDELLMIKGIDRRTYETLLPYVTVHGYSGRPNDPLVNINTASIPVIMSLNESISKGHAEQIVKYRKLMPLAKTSDVQKVPGFDGPLGTSLMGRIAVQPANARITSVSEENGIKRVIETVVNISGLGKAVYWREM